MLQQMSALKVEGDCRVGKRVRVATVTQSEIAYWLIKGFGWW